MERILPSAEEGLDIKDLENSVPKNEGFEYKHLLGEDLADELAEELPVVVRSKGSSLDGRNKSLVCKFVKFNSSANHCSSSWTGMGLILRSSGVTE